MTLLSRESQIIGKHLSHIRIATRDQMRALKDPKDSRDMRYLVAQAKGLETTARGLIADVKRIYDATTRRKVLTDAMAIYKFANEGVAQIADAYRRGTEGSYVHQLSQRNTHDLYGAIWGMVEGIKKTYKVKTYRIKKGGVKSNPAIAKWNRAYQSETTALRKVARDLANIYRASQQPPSSPDSRGLERSVDILDRRFSDVLHYLKKNTSARIPYRMTAVYDAINTLPDNKRKDYHDFFERNSYLIDNFVIPPATHNQWGRAVKRLVTSVGLRRAWFQKLNRELSNIKGYRIKSVKSLGRNEVLEVIGLVERLKGDAERGYPKRQLVRTLAKIQNILQNRDTANRYSGYVYRNLQRLTRAVRGSSNESPDKGVVDYSDALIRALQKYMVEMKTEQGGGHDKNRIALLDSVRELMAGLQKVERINDPARQQRAFNAVIQAYERKARHLTRGSFSAPDMATLRQLFYATTERGITEKGKAQYWSRIYAILKKHANAFGR